MQLRVSPGYDKPAQQFFRSRHYRQPFDVGAVYRRLASVPPTARLSATSALVPHVAARPYIYLFPFVGDADYILALPPASVYPLTESALSQQLAGYLASGDWRELPGPPPLRILQRRRPLPPTGGHWGALWAFWGRRFAGSSALARRGVFAARSANWPFSLVGALGALAG